MEVKSLADFFVAIDTAHAGLQCQPWWRGHGRSDWELVPKVFRSVDKGQRYETNIALKFVQKAQTRHPICPDPSNRHEWLFLMQHYGLPTRISDWSESPLVAAYFVVSEEKHDGEDGAIWALDPFRMGEVFEGVKGLSDPRHPRVKLFIDKVFEGGDPTDNYAVGIIASEVDPRMMVQQAAMVVHGAPMPLNEYDAMEPLLKKIVIRADAKAALRLWLARVGIRERTIFPDLMHLASDLAADRYAP